MEESHVVSLNITVIQAETGSKPLPFYETTRNNRRKRIYESVKPKNYYHLEYQLQPGASSPTFSTDVVTYGIVTKVFTNQDERLVRSWTEDGLVYHGWKHNHKIALTMDSLLELYNHTFCAHLWNSPDKVSARARYDRPKAFRLPLSKRDPKDNKHFPGVYHDLSTTSVKFARRRSRRLSEVMDFDGIEDSMEYLVSQKSQMIPPIIEEIHFEDKNYPSSNIIPSQTQIATQSQSTTITSTSLTPGLKGVSKQHIKQLQDESNEKERINKEGLVVISIKLADLFGNDHMAKATLKECKGDLKVFEVIVSFDSPLMTEKQRMVLNPMTVTIKDCTLPPLPEYENSKINVSYQFLDKSVVQTDSLPYSCVLAWNSSNVLLLGTIVPELLLEYLRGPPLIFEMHIQNIGEVESVNTKGRSEAAVFGQLIHDQVLGTCKCNDAFNGAKYKDRLNPEAKLDLSTLLTGLTTMEFNLPILNPTSHQTKESNMNFVGHDSQLTVTINLTFPLFFPSLLVEGDVLLQRPMTPFGRLIYIISTANIELVEKVIALISDINSTELNLTDKTASQRNAILSTFKLTEEQVMSSYCDVVTGFHVEDTNNHIFMLEGLHSRGIKRLWEALPHQSTQGQIVKLFYDSDYSFSKRAYGKLDVDIVHILLPQSLQIIMKEPTVYLHDSIPNLCFMALSTLHDLKFAQDFSCIMRNNMFPSYEMISNLSVYCLQLMPAKTEQEPSTALIPLTESKIKKQSRNLEPLDDVNHKYESLLEERKQMPVPDMIAHNILKVQKMSDEVKQTRKFRRRSTSEGNKPVSLYSSQTYNSSVTNKALLREKMDPKWRYTYCQHYHSMTVEPVDVEKELKLYWHRGDRAKWISNEDFVLPGHKTALESNVHSKQLHISRRDEIKKKFEDNLLHSNTLQPTVDWLKFQWENRSHDFERYKQPTPYFGSQYPVTIHLAGERRKEEIKDFKDKESEKWKSKMVVGSMQFCTLRQGIKTEQSLRAASQQDKLKSLLKDEPIIPSAIAPSEHLRVDTLPALATTCIKKDENEKGLVGYLPGDISLCRSLKQDCNVIPIYKQLSSTH